VHRYLYLRRTICYEKDPEVVAKEAIQEATRNKSDIVLVDTAGRMQVGLCGLICMLINLTRY
jgi:signal recognition particle receptor subunit alpha